MGHSRLLVYKQHILGFATVGLSGGRQHCLSDTTPAFQLPSAQKLLLLIRDKTFLALLVISRQEAMVKVSSSSLDADNTGRLRVLTWKQRRAESSQSHLQAKHLQQTSR
jgi:hypothetical protein